MASPSPAFRRHAFAVSIALLVYGNCVSLFANDTRQTFLLYTNLAVMCALVAFALALGTTRRELGLAPGTWMRDAMWGAALGLALALIPVAFILIAPFVTGDPLHVEDIDTLAGREIALRVAFRVPVGTALPEEVISRGVLFALWLRASGESAAVLATSLVFALWHIVISFGSVSGAGVVERPELVAAGYLLALAGLFIGGVMFAWLRIRTGNVVAPVVVHWLVVALMQLAVWARA
jgi:membrane protease YdiL (CAAX protease family)